MRILIILALSFFITSPLSAQQQLPCGTEKSIKAQLEEKYNELPVAFLGQDSQNTFIIYSNHLTGTWTLVKTHVSGHSCLASSGKGGFGTMERFVGSKS